MEIVVHHWDADGISSAAIVMKEKGRLPAFTPPIGEFKFDPRIESGVYSSKLSYFIDLNMPEAVVDLANRGIISKAIFIDHHIQKPIKHEKIEYYNKPYPSASFLVSELFNHESYLTVLGGVGDLGEKLFEVEDFGERAERILDTEGISKKEIIKAVKLVDCNHLTLDRYGVEEAVFYLLNAEIDDILSRDEWIEKLRDIESEVSRIVKSAKIERGIARVEFYSPNSIISRVARELVWNKGAKACLAINRGFNGKYQVYLRISKGNEKMKNLIEKLRHIGVNAGGKAEVLGSVFEGEDKLKLVLEEIEKFLNSEVVE